MITPLMASHKDFDVYRVPPTGDQATARALLAEAGALGSRITIDFADTPTNAAAAAGFRTALDESGFVTSLKPIDADVYYSTIGVSAAEDELVLAGWAPDWTNGSSVIPPLFDGRRITVRGNENYAQLDDPEINALIDQANLETDLHHQAGLWGDLDEKVLEKAAVVPLIYDRTNQLVGSKVKGGFLHSFYGQTDLATLSVG
ncbi:MAG TPA: ABC transporter substrate-binding protein, partial [Candidatus Eisenbacteria bacterium]|nr:ABC transporter substrate-binding protein [Candidatus Eisenbacteria bacterium]